MSKHVKVPENMQFLRFDPPYTVVFVTLGEQDKPSEQFQELLAEDAREHWEQIVLLAGKVASPEVYKAMLTRFQTMLLQAKSQGVSQDLVLGLQTKALDNIARTRHIVAKALEPYLQRNWILLQEQVVQLQKLTEEADFQRARADQMEEELARYDLDSQQVAFEPKPKKETAGEEASTDRSLAYACPSCQNEFATKQALGGHRRHCKAK